MKTAPKIPRRRNGLGAARLLRVAGCPSSGVDCIFLALLFSLDVLRRVELLSRFAVSPGRNPLLYWRWYIWSLLLVMYLTSVIGGTCPKASHPIGSWARWPLLSCSLIGREVSTNAADWLTMMSASKIQSEWRVYGKDSDTYNIHFSFQLANWNKILQV